MPFIPMIRPDIANLVVLHAYSARMMTMYGHLKLPTAQTWECIWVWGPTLRAEKRQARMSWMSYVTLVNGTRSLKSTFVMYQALYSFY